MFARVCASVGDGVMRIVERNVDPLHERNYFHKSKI